MEADTKKKPSETIRAVKALEEEMHQLREDFRVTRQQIDDVNFKLAPLYANFNLINDKLEGMKKMLVDIASDTFFSVVNRTLTRLLAKVPKQVKDSLPVSSLTGCPLNEAEINYIKKNQVIEAIKEVRARTGLGLKEAKDMVEAWRYRV